MKTKELNAKVFPYILNNIDTNGYDIYVEDTDSAKLQFLAETFVNEYVHPYSLNHDKSYQGMFAGWLMGLPSAVHIDFENYRILEIAKEWGSIPPGASEREEYKILSNWFNFIAGKTYQLFKKHKIDIFAMIQAKLAA